MAELGLRRTTGNRVYRERYRGFESLSLRHVAANLESFAATFLFFGENVTAHPLGCGSFPQKITLGSPIRL